jgi:exosome complex component RRP45
MDNDRSSFTVNELSAASATLAVRERPDGRLPFSPRRFTLRFSPSACLVTLGATIVSCRTSPEQAAPHEERPSEGIHTIAIHSLSRLDESFGRESVHELKTALHRTRALDLESLVLKLGESVWALRSDLTIVNNDGGLLPALQLALLGSLMATKLPGPRGLRAVVLHHLPIAVSFGYLDGLSCFVDPTALETAVCQGVVTLFLNVSGEICALYKIGGGGIPPALIEQLLALGMDIAVAWHGEIMEQMGADAPPMLKNLVKRVERPVKEAARDGEPAVVEPETEAEEEEQFENLPPSLLALFQ